MEVSQQCQSQPSCHPQQVLLALSCHSATPQPFHLLTCKGRLGIRQVIPNPTSRKLVNTKALVALVIFWIWRSRFFFFLSPLEGQQNPCYKHTSSSCWNSQQDSPHITSTLSTPVWLQVCLGRCWDLHQWKLRNTWAIISVLLLFLLG